MDFTLTPFTILADTREQHPYTFTGINADARQRRKPVIVKVMQATLPTGDYSLDGLTSRIAIERKSLADLFGTLGQGRDRFIRELERLNEMECAAVVVEADWPTIMGTPPPHSKLLPKTVYRSVLAWENRYRNVHWWMCGTRTFAERTVFRKLERFWRDEVEKAKAEQEQLHTGA